MHIRVKMQLSRTTRAPSQPTLQQLRRTLGALHRHLHPIPSRLDLQKAVGSVIDRLSSKKKTNTALETETKSLKSS